MGCAIRTMCTWQAPISWTTCSTGVLTSKFQRSLSGCFPLRTANALPPGILAAVEKKLKSLDSQFHSRRIRVRAVGRLELLPPSTLAAVRAAEAATEGYTCMHLTIAAAYGGREEITDAVKALRSIRRPSARSRIRQTAPELRLGLPTRNGSTAVGEICRKARIDRAVHRRASQRRCGALDLTRHTSITLTDR